MNVRADNRCSESGVTLIELMLVLIVMVIIATAALPGIMSIGKGVGVKGAISSISATLNLSRQWAVSRREETGFFYTRLSDDSTNNLYWVQDRMGSVIQATNTLPAGVLFNEADGFSEEIWFRSDGSLPGLTKTVRLMDKNRPDMTNAVKIYGLTGVVRVVE